MHVRGFVISGSLFALLLIMLIAGNYVIISNANLDDSNYEKLMIDKVSNRNTDVLRLIDDLNVDTIADITGCTSTLFEMSTRLSTILTDSRLDSEDITLSVNDLTIVDNCPTLRVEINYELNSITGVRRLVLFNKSYSA